MNWILLFILFYLRSFSFICIVCTCIAAFWQLFNNKRINEYHIKRSLSILTPCPDHVSALYQLEHSQLTCTSCTRRLQLETDARFFDQCCQSCQTFVSIDCSVFSSNNMVHRVYLDRTFTRCLTQRDRAMQVLLIFRKVTKIYNLYRFLSIEVHLYSWSYLRFGTIIWVI